MSDGLITRIGKWIDFKWESKATFRDLLDQETNCSKRHIGALAAIVEAKAGLAQEIAAIRAESIVSPKDFAELKERMNHLEVYVGMRRVVDPTKAPVAKSAFAM